MNRSIRLLAPWLLIMLPACVTINVYFPAAAAEKAADKIINDVWGLDGDKAAEPDKTSATRAAPAVLVAVVDWLIAPAAAQTPDLDVTSPAIGKLQGTMRKRHGALEPHYDSGAVGLTDDGMVKVRDPKAAPLRDRQTVTRLVADENEDRAALYREIARANGHPEWEPEIRRTFARRWIGNAKRGWWYEAKGGWAQK